MLYDIGIVALFIMAVVPWIFSSVTRKNNDRNLARLIATAMKGEKQ